MLVLAILSTPLSNFSEVVNILQGQYFMLAEYSMSTSQTPLWLKAIKDLLVLAIFARGLGLSLLRQRISTAYWVCIATFVFSLILTLESKGAVHGIISVRWFMPMIIFPVFSRYVDLRVQKAIEKTLSGVLLFALFLQVYQFLFAAPVYDLDRLGFSLRNSGIYLIPSTMASFAIMSLYYTYNFAPHGLRRTCFLFFVCPVSIFLTSSGAGLLSLIGFLAIGLAVKGRFDKRALVLTGCFAFCCIMVFLPVVSGRETIFESLADRLDILKTIHAGWLFSSDTALATNAARIFGHATPELDIVGITADSMVVSLLSGIGILGTISFALFFLKRIVDLDSVWLLFFVSTIPFLLSTVAFEVFPFGILMMLNLAFLTKFRGGTVERGTLFGA